MKNPDYKVGKFTVTKVWELDLDKFDATQLLPGVQPETLATDPAAQDSRTYNPQTKKVRLSVHSWLVRDGAKTILIDAGGGNGKDRPKLKALDHLRTPYLARLIAAGVRPEEINYVLLTHLHADHVGWNTVSGRPLGSYLSKCHRPLLDSGVALRGGAGGWGRASDSGRTERCGPG